MSALISLHWDGAIGVALAVLNIILVALKAGPKVGNAALRFFAVVDSLSPGFWSAWLDLTQDADTVRKRHHWQPAPVPNLLTTEQPTARLPPPGL